MELKVKEITIPEVIEFNFEELKQEITEKASMYSSIVYTDKQIKEAKADRANLNKFVKALADERIKVKKQCLAPYEAFEKKVNELSQIVQEPIGIIDSQVKKFEEEQKLQKEKEITVYFIGKYEEEGSEVPEWLKLEQIFNDKWLNASTSMKSIQDEIDEKIQLVNMNIKALESLPEFSFEAIEVYKTNLDMNRAILEAQRMSEIAKKKAEAEAVTKAAEEAKVEEEPFPMPEPVVEKKEEVQKQWVTFKALLSTEDALALKEFFKNRNITFERG